MSKPNHVPKFGNWDANEQTPFTLVFEKARADHKVGAGAGNKVINPNDPSEYPPEYFAAYGIKSSQRTPPQYYEDESEQRMDTAHVGANISGPPGRPTAVEHGKKGSYGGTRDSEGMGLREGHYSEQSPSHPSSPFRGRLGNKPTVPSYLGPDKKWPRDDGAPPNHPAKTRLHPASRGEDMFPERSSALPKFGAWDENDPNSGDGFTVIFSNARNEKIGGPARIPALQSDSPVKGDFDDAYKAPHQSFQQKVARWLCFRA
ncbi:hypothetical protein GOP47_0011253 [Adiantum capillus-veneris]|uniref:RIN4 pathogenic type III effector avirulence factor Avr cleavage site domain-containing protein n=1 Tax=Adiantum capillus-veneris TaxID=13818 RepID=A0A9D4ZHG0_ADICA|nr:hypothetical protein GOP47_0011253 [Adiantum capillus-veneris]